MGLRLVARYYDRSEAFIALGALEAAGVVAFLENHVQISVVPFEEIARGGYRLMIPDEELNDAIAVLTEAKRKRSFEGERLSQRAYLVPALLLFLLIGVPLPFRTSKWHEV